MKKRPPVPARVLAKVRALCAPMRGAAEQVAWVGVRWQVRKRMFAHVLVVGDGWPPAYARAVGAGAGESLVVLTFRAEGPLVDAFRALGDPFFVPPWGTTWGTQVVGVKLEGRVDWKRIKALLTESHALLAPKSWRQHD